jgi:hypothetical protein
MIQRATFWLSGRVWVRFRIPRHQASATNVTFGVGIMSSDKPPHAPTRLAYVDYQPPAAGVTGTYNVTVGVRSPPPRKQQSGKSSSSSSGGGSGGSSSGGSSSSSGKSSSGSSSGGGGKSSSGSSSGGGGGKSSSSRGDSSGNGGGAEDSLQLTADDTELDVRVFFDGHFAEIFFMGGRVAMTVPIHATRSAGFSVFALGEEGGSISTSPAAAVEVVRAEAYHMRSIWISKEEVLRG